MAGIAPLDLVLARMREIRPELDRLSLMPGKLSGPQQARYNELTVEWAELDDRRDDLEERTQRATAAAGTNFTPESAGDVRHASGLADVLIRGGFNLRQNLSVVGSGYEALVSTRANTFPASTVLNPIPASQVYPMGRDSRFLWPMLPTIDAKNDTSINDFKQTAAALTGTVERAIDAATTKANVDVTIVAVVEALKQYAVTINSVPNIVLESIPLMTTLLDGEATFQINKALDDAVLAQIVAATPAFGNTGTTTIDKVRNAIASMRAAGANPNVLVLNPTDAAALDLFRVGGSTATDGPYAYDFTAGPSHPLWGLKVVERIGGGSDPMYLLDTDMLGALYLGQLRFDIDPYTEFKKNLSTLRAEVNALFHVRQIAGARRIAAS